MSDEAAKHYKLEILEANLYVLKMTLYDDVMSDIEKLLLSSHASYPFETIKRLLLCVKNKNLIFTDPLGQAISFYKDVYRRLVSTQGDVQLCQVLENQPIQSQDLKLCGLFCVYIAHLIFSFQPIVECTDKDSTRFGLHLMMIYLYQWFKEIQFFQNLIFSSYTKQMNNKCLSIF